MYQDNEWKYVALLNRNIAPGQGMNLFAHGVNALARQLGDHPGLRFVPYQNGSGGSHGDLSVWPYIVLESPSSEKIRQLRKSLRELGIPCVEVLASMIGASSEAQQEQTRALPEAQVEYLGLFTFGRADALQPLIKRFSLFKGFRGGSEVEQPEAAQSAEGLTQPGESIRS